MLVAMGKRDEKKLLTLFSEIKKTKSQIAVDVPVWAKDELLLKLQELYSAVILLDPVLAVGQKFEVELWNSVFRQPIQCYQEILRQKLTGTTKTNCRSSSEIQHRLTILLERASGFYDSLIHKLLCKLPNESWRKLFISELYQGRTRISVTNHKSHLGAGRLDLDEVTLQMQLLRSSIRASRSGLRLVDLDKLGDHNGTQAPSVAPTILSRGTQLPDGDVLIDLNPQESEFSKLSTVETNTPSSEVTPNNPVSKISLSDAIVYVIQHSLIHLGDVARYQNHPLIASTYYTWAWLVDPTSGHPYNQLAILESVKQKKQFEDLCYFYIRAVSCLHPFPAASENLTQMFKLLSSSAISREPLSQVESLRCLEDLQEVFRAPSHLLLRFHALVWTHGDVASIVRAADDLSTTIAILTHVSRKTSSNPLPESWPSALSTRIRTFQSEFEQFRLQTDNAAVNFRQPFLKLVMRLVTLMVVHIHGMCLPPSDSASASTTRRCLLFLTVRLLTWLSDLVLTVSEFLRSAECEDTLEPKALLLPPLFVLSLWLKQQQTEPGPSKLSDADFLQYAPPVGESVIELLNSLWDSHPQREYCYSEVQPRDEQLLLLPEVFALRGFTLMGLPSVKVDLSTTLDEILPERLLDFSAPPPPHMLLLRTKFVLQNFRWLAAEFPSLLSWREIGSASGGAFEVLHRDTVSLPTVDTEEALNAHDEDKHPSDAATATIQLPVPTLVANDYEVMPENAEAKSAETAADTLEDATSLQVDDTHTALEIVQFSGQPHADVETASSEVSNPPAVGSEPPSTPPPPLPSSPLLTPVEAAPLPIECTPGATTQPAAVEETTEQQPAPKTSNSNAAATTISEHARGFCSGGLIVNAELARFIQEQASQVAARQSSQLTSSVAQLPADRSSINTGQRSDGGTSSRSLFRKNLPPRFLRRLHAEQQEREMKDNSVNLTRLDQPAPLALKESEGSFLEPAPLTGPQMSFNMQPNFDSTPQQYPCPPSGTSSTATGFMSAPKRPFFPATAFPSDGPAVFSPAVPPPMPLTRPSPSHLASAAVAAAAAAGYKWPPATWLQPGLSVQPPQPPITWYNGEMFLPNPGMNFANSATADYANRPQMLPPRQPPFQ
uniref:Protein SMG7 n=2 Tax=Schistocephalus solidus TaxID=70667 RepID=A0A0X3NI43_SCHSO